MKKVKVMLVMGLLLLVCMPQAFAVSGGYSNEPMLGWITEGGQCTSLEGFSKKGSSHYIALGFPFFFDIVAFGDAGISTAMEDGNIKRIHHTERTQLNLVFFKLVSTTVHGI